jgi:hypothetical protein
VAAPTGTEDDFVIFHGALAKQPFDDYVGGNKEENKGGDDVSYDQGIGTRNEEKQGADESGQKN